MNMGFGNGGFVKTQCGRLKALVESKSGQDTHHTGTTEDWKKLLFTNESKFEILDLLRRIILLCLKK